MGSVEFSLIKQLEKYHVSYKCWKRLTSGPLSTGFNSFSQASDAGWHTEVRLSTTTATHKFFIVALMPVCLSGLSYINFFGHFCAPPLSESNLIWTLTLNVSIPRWPFRLFVKQTVMRLLPLTNWRKGLTGQVQIPVCFAVSWEYDDQIWSS